jgi:hypothetical protein
LPTATFERAEEATTVAVAIFVTVVVVVVVVLLLDCCEDDKDPLLLGSRVCIEAGDPMVDADDSVGDETEVEETEVEAEVLVDLESASEGSEDFCFFGLNDF